MKNLKSLFGIAIMVLFILSSCQKEETKEIIKADESVTADLAIQTDVESVLKEMTLLMDEKMGGGCDCDLVQQADFGQGDAGVDIDDLIYLIWIFNEFDYDGDDCVTFNTKPGTGFSDDLWGWINAGDTTPKHDYDGNGVIDGLDAREAFQTAGTFGALTGDDGLCLDDLYCVWYYIRGDDCQ